MKIKIEEEAFFDFALKGLARSYFKGDEPFEYFFTDEKRDKMIHLCRVLNEKAHKEGNFAHSKVLRQMAVAITITTTRGAWSHFDTYKIGIENGDVSQSESTMHTIKKRLLTKDDFSENTDQRSIDIVNEKIESKAPVSVIKDNLPEGFLQTRNYTTNYATLQNIITQRKGHLLGEWDSFAEQLKEQLQHPEILIF